MPLWIAAAAGVSAGCNLHGFNNDRGGAINLASAGARILVARGTLGLEVLDAATGEVVQQLAPAGGADSFDDVAAAGALAVALDADDGVLVSFRFTSEGLELADVVPRVAVGPYSGVALDERHVVVSGGTKDATLFAIGPEGRLSEVARVEGHRGHPRVTMIPDLQAALVSVHFSGGDRPEGHEFGVATLSMTERRFVASAGLEGAGFTDGGGRPASWPGGAHVARELAYVAHGGGLELLRVGAGLELERVARLRLPMAGVHVHVDGSEAFVVGASPSRLVVVDVSDPARPEIRREVSVGEEDDAPSAVIATPEHIFVALPRRGVLRLPRAE